jgi:3-dehydroquinate synthase class II
VQVLVEAETPDGEVHSLLLQNAETVRLVGPSGEPPSRVLGGSAAEGEQPSAGWQAVSVSELQVGQAVYVRRQAAARHTGISIEEFIRER